MPSIVTMKTARIVMGNKIKQDKCKKLGGHAPKTDSGNIIQDFANETTSHTTPSTRTETAIWGAVREIDMEKAIEVLNRHGIDSAGMVDELQDRMQRRVAFDEDLTEEGRENLRWAINDIDRYRKTKMTNEEINQYIHNEIMEGCWHEIDQDGDCVNCPTIVGFNGPLGPDYCGSLDLVWTVVQKVLRSEDSKERLADAMNAVNWKYVFSDASQTAKQLAIECMKAWEYVPNSGNRGFVYRCGEGMGI